MVSILRTVLTAGDKLPLLGRLQSLTMSWMAAPTRRPFPMCSMMKTSDSLFSSCVAGKWIKTNCLNDIPVSLSTESAASMIEKG